jgi:hypothetical protein
MARMAPALSARVGAVIALAFGALAIIAATVAGTNADVLAVVVTPPPFIRAALVGGAVAVGLILFARSVGRLAESGSDDVPGLIRAVRLAFLGVAAWSAAAGWALGHPLPLIVAAVIAGVDVIETSFLLLVVGRGR